MEREPEHAFMRDESYAAAVAFAIVGCQWWIMADLGLPTRWALPVALSIILVAVVFVWFVPSTARVTRYALQVALIGLLVLANVVNLVAIGMQALFDIGHGATELLFTGFILWVMNVFVFALAYWLVDGGGPLARSETDRFMPDWVFPQQTDAEHSPEDWRALFGDYLYLAFTGAIAFGPTDAMPYTRRAKTLMTVEAAIALATLGVIIARAVSLAGT